MSALDAPRDPADPMERDVEVVPCGGCHGSGLAYAPGRPDGRYASSPPEPDIVGCPDCQGTGEAMPADSAMPKEDSRG